MSRPTASAIRPESPEITTEAGPLTAARSRSPHSSRTSASPAVTATIRPAPGSPCISRPRAATSFTASARDSTPATWAALSSPMECPSSTDGRMPQESSSAAIATSTANNAGCAFPVASRSPPSKTISRSGRPNSAHTASNSSRNTGKAS